LSLWVRHYLRDLVEAAFPMDHAKQRLVGLQDVVTEHLFKAYFLSGDSSYRHWLSELSGWSVTLARYNRKKPGGKQRNYSRALLQRVLWDEPFGTSEDLMGLADLFEVDKNLVMAGVDGFRAFVFSYIEAIHHRVRWRKQ
jgi:hypothetical protein